MIYSSSSELISSTTTMAVTLTPPSPSILQTTILSLILNFILIIQASKNPDLHPLMSFKASSDTSNKLTTWKSTTGLCTWYGVSCLRNRVSHLVLENLDLEGSIHPLTSLTQLRVLSLKGNHFTGPIPNLSNLTAIKLLFLSHNKFSGEFPTTVTSLTHLYRLDLSHNNLSGEIPTTVNRLTHLLTLRLDGNQIEGHIPNINLSNLQDLNVSNNLLSGRIPESLSGFSGSSFLQNPSLCGVPLQKCKDLPALASPLVTSNEAFPRNSGGPTWSPKNKSGHNGGGRMKCIVIMGIVVGDVLILVVVSLVLYCYFWRNYSEGKRRGGSKSVYNYRRRSGNGMVFLEGSKRFEVEELLRASAEMLGKGAFGTSYKAILDDGSVVAVKRLKELINIGGKREFEQRMEVLGRFRHPNVLSLRAYYFAKDEKLLVSDYMPNGTLFCLLHGNRGPGRSPVEWSTRLKIAAEAARGVAFIHNNIMIHGNIKSSNILLDVANNARVADFGLSILAGPTNTRSNGYRAPEASDGRKESKKSDVYAFGVLLMELLTGKCPYAADGCADVVDLPRWIQSVVKEEWTAEVFDLELLKYKDIEEDMVALLQIAIHCTATLPDLRPSITHVVKMIDDLLRGVQL